MIARAIIQPRTRPCGGGRIPALLLACLLAGISPGVLGADIVVDTLDDVVADDGVCSLREAIDNANDDLQTHADCPAGTGSDTIRLAQTQALFDALAGDLELTGAELIVSDAGGTPGESLTIDGRVADPSSSDEPPPERTLMIDGGGSRESEAGACTTGEDNRVGRIFSIQTAATFTNLTLTNACIEGDGGIIFNASALTLTGVSISNGSALEVAEAGGHGGAIFNDAGATLTIDEGSQIANSFASRRGGGIANLSTAPIVGGCPAVTVPEVTDCTISLESTTLSGNFAGLNDTLEGGSGTLLLGSGGALHNAGGTVAGRSVTVNSNLATVSGGGIWNSGTGTVALLDATVQSNQAQALALTLEDQDLRGGGAIFNDGGTLNLEFATLSGNSVVHNDVFQAITFPAVRGGAIASTGGVLDFDTVAMTQNQTGQAEVKNDDGEIVQPLIPGLGGALYIASGTAAIRDSTLIQNAAQTEGGAIWSDAGMPGDPEPSMVVQRTTLLGNQAQNGGGLYNQGAAEIDGGRLFANQGNSQEGMGGGIFNAADATLAINGVQIGQNSAAFGAGIDNAGELTLTQVFLGATQTESRNRAGADGGGLRNRSGGIATIENSSIVFNDAGAGDLGDNSGGGIWNAGTLSVTNSTFSDNRALNGGAGSGLFQAGGSATLRFTTLAGGVTAANGAADVVAESSLVTKAAGGSIAADSFSLINPGSPGLEGLKLFGGATPTRPLRAGSAAVDAGEQSNCDSIGNLDQRGAARPPDGSGNGSGCDTGSFERTDDAVLTVGRNGPQQISVQSQIGGDLAVLAFSIANNGDDSVTVGGFKLRPLFNGGIEALRQLVRNDPEVGGQLQFDVVLDDGAGENAGNGLLDDDETTVVGTGDGRNLDCTQVQCNIAAGNSEDLLIVLRLPEAETETAGLPSMSPILAGGLLIGLLGLVRIRGLHRRAQWLLVIGLLTAGLTACSETTGIDNIEPPLPPVPDPSLQGQLRFKLYQLTPDAAGETAGEILIGDGLPVFGPAIFVQ